MVKFSSLVAVIKNYLEGNIEAGITIEEGKHGELPSTPPTVWIYIEPDRIADKNSRNEPVLRWAKVTFFAVETGSSSTEAKNKSIDLIEKVEHLLFSDDEKFLNFVNAHADNINDTPTGVTYSEFDQPLGFDGMYSDNAVSFLETKITYSPFWKV